MAAAAKLQQHRQQHQLPSDHLRGEQARQIRKGQHRRRRRLKWQITKRLINKK